MLGNLIIEEKGKVTAKRVLDSDNIEITFEAKTKIKGIDGMNLGTYTSKTMPDGSMFGQGQGCVMTGDGQMVTWKGSGAGRFLDAGKIRYAGAIFLSTQSKGSQEF